MENASKALIIAASILIVIVLIAIGIKLLGSTKGVTNEVEGVSNAMELSLFNSQFTDYEGTQSGTQVKILLNKAAATYRNGNTRTVSVNGNTTSNDIAAYRATISVNQTYTVVVTDNDGDGFVDTITVS